VISENAKIKLQSGDVLYGAISPTIDPTVCEYLGWAGLDFYMIDGEHGPIDVSNAIDMIRACEISGISPWARIRSVDEKLILQYLDAGIVGVMMPGITNLAQVSDLVNAIKYPPMGKRGLGPVRAGDYLAGSKNQWQYIEYANNTTLIFPQMEDIVCMQFLDEMLAMEGVDGVIIGPRDLAMSMGYYDGPAHPEVKAVMNEVFEKTIAAGKIVGTVAATKEQADTLIGQGAKIILNSVQGLLTSAVKMLK
jgi:4-hydroxy-2-oxoheptanedioate aldolase